MNDIRHRDSRGAFVQITGRWLRRWAAAWAGLSLLFVQHDLQGAHRPNILWITVEDMSANLGCYDDSFATTPNLDEYAHQAVRFTHAFATAPVCSPARSCLISGLYATSLGTQRLRSHFPIPQWCRPFPAYLREAGYFTSNNVKTDYNARDEDDLIRDAWDVNGPRAHWRQRNPEQPFFSVFNLMTTHQSRTNVWSFEQFERDVVSQGRPPIRHDHEQVPLPPYYPDTSLVRRTVARYYDCISVMDQQVARILDELKQDGLVDDTIVFFFSDHGMGMPRGKRMLHDSGMHVPLMIRVPAKYGHFAPAKPGAAIDRLVSFVDFPRTILELADIQAPPRLQGSCFLGPESDPPRDDVFGARDRVDEVLELSRSIRDSRYLYIRNYMPQLSWMPPERYSDGSEMRRQMLQFREENRFSEAQWTYAAPRKSPEELYDTYNDPHQIRNLASEPSMAPVLGRLRGRLEQLIIETRDVGFLPESDAWARLDQDTPWDLAQDSSRYPLRRILEVAGRVGLKRDPAVFLPHLTDDDPAVRYWSVIGLHAANVSSPPVMERLRIALRDDAPDVRIAASGALLSCGDAKSALPILTNALASDNVDVILPAMRTIELNALRVTIDDRLIDDLLDRARRNEEAETHPNWMFVRFSAEAFKERRGK